MPRLSLSEHWCCGCLALAMADCGAQVQPPQPVASANPWRVELTLSGGLAGVERVLELSSTGHLNIIDKRISRQVTTQLPNEELVKIFALLVDTSHLQPPGTPPACRDCFQYDLDVRMDGQQFSFRVNDLNMAQAGLSPLVKALKALQDRALKGQSQP